MSKIQRGQIEMLGYAGQEFSLGVEDKIVEKSRDLIKSSILERLIAIGQRGV